MSRSQLRSITLLACAGVVMTGCHTDMWVQPKHHHPYQKNELFDDGMSSRPLVEGTVPMGGAKTDSARFEGRVDGKLVNALPATLTILGEKVDTKKDLKKVLQRGQERFHIYCSHCHGDTGDGKGMISQRGLVLKRPPASYHTDRLRNMPLGHFYNVIARGYGTMYSQASRVKTDDRWAIVAYIRALQMSQNTKASELTAEELKMLNNPGSTKPTVEKTGGHE
ncbi:MAG: cytochrome c [Chthonomonas sp.]|nr:cytochrome c [Chthonomonas sp.]